MTTSPITDFTHCDQDDFFNLVNQFLCTNFEYVLLRFYFDLKKMSEFVQAKSKTIFSKGIESEK